MSWKTKNNEKVVPDFKSLKKIWLLNVEYDPGLDPRSKGGKVAKKKKKKHYWDNWQNEKPVY